MCTYIVSESTTAEEVQWFVGDFITSNNVAESTELIRTDILTSAFLVDQTVEYYEQQVSCRCLFVIL